MQRGASIFIICLVGCGEVATEQPAGHASIRQAGYERQGYERQGYERQGYERQGYELGVSAFKGFSLESLLRSPKPLFDKAELIEGELVLTESPITGETASLGACATPTAGLGRSCGWRSAGVGTCSVGSWVTVRDVGATDSMLRACAGTTPCEAGAAIAANDDFGGTLQARVDFWCPFSGTFNLEVAPYYSPQVATVSLVPAGTITYPVLAIRRGADLAGRALKAVTFDGTTQQVHLNGVWPELSRPRLAADGVTPGNVPDAATFRYQVNVDVGPNGQPLCGPDLLDDDGETRPTAIATPGWWDARATRHDDADLFTFSCRRGVITKCYRWGYRPFLTLAEAVNGGSDAQKKNAMQACTRMARADYCGDGNSWTREDTFVGIYDDDGVQVPGAVSDLPAEEAPGFAFEAAWLPSGATCVSRTRWSFAPPSVMYENCKVLFEQAPPHQPKICNTIDEGRARGARLFNDSSHHEWVDAGS